MERRKLFKWLGVGAASISLNPVKFLASAPLVERPHPIFSGMLGQLDGVPLIVTEQIPRATLIKIHNRMNSATPCSQIFTVSPSVFTDIKNGQLGEWKDDEHDQA